MKRIFRAVKLSLVLAFLAACGGGGSLGNELGLRIINASPDAPPINFILDGTVWFSLDYTLGTRFNYLTPGSRQMELQVLLPSAPVLIEAPPVSLAGGHEYTTIAVGKLSEAGSSTLQMLSIDNPVATVPAGMTRVQFVHAAPDIAAAIDVYLTAPADSLAAATPQFSISYIQQPTALQLDILSGIGRIRVTPSGDRNTVLFDSGEVTLRSTASLLFVVVTNTGAGAAPVSLLINDGLFSTEILDAGTPSDVRVYNVSPDLPSLVATAERALRKDTLPPDPPLASPCVYDPTLAADDVLCVAPPPEVTPVVAGLTYPAAASYVGLDFRTLPPAGYAFLNSANFYSLKVAATDAPATTLFGTSLSLVQGKRSSLLTVGLVPQPVESVVTAKILAVLNDDIRPIARVGKLRIVDASVAGGTVDVYIKTQGTDLSSETASLPNLGLGSATGHLGFAPGPYTVSFTTAGTKTVLASVNVDALGASVFTVVLVDTARSISGDGTPPEVMVIDDLL